MQIGSLAACLVVLCAISQATDTETEFLERNRYARELNPDLLSVSPSRDKRQTSGVTEEYHVTQCSHDNTEVPDGASINVKGILLQYPESTIEAARQIHQIVRFMPRYLFLRLAQFSAVGLFSVQHLPANIFDEFLNYMPFECAATCRVVTLPDGTPYDCGAYWCTAPDYSYNPNYPINYLWAYGNFSRMFVVETNVVCKGFNPGSALENYLIREFGLMLLTRAFDEKLSRDLYDAYNEAVSNNTWTVDNVYDYFMKGTQAWFNGAVKSPNTDLGGMLCIGVYGTDGRMLCEDAMSQRRFMKQQDPKLYRLLNHVYNNDRSYVQSETSTCP